jgi:hypothetical protein
MVGWGDWNNIVLGSGTKTWEGKGQLVHSHEHHGKSVENGLKEVSILQVWRGGLQPSRSQTHGSMF